MRIVALADTHLYTDDLVVPEGDILIHAGDLCRRGNFNELAKAATWFNALPHRHKIVVAGNHDWAFLDEPVEARALFEHYLQDSEISIAGLRIYGAPWQPAYNDWAFNLPRGPALAAKWALIPSGLDVLVTHGPPEGIGDDIELVGRSGCADLLARVRVAAPRLHMFGHIHADGGLWVRGPTTFANVTTWECERAPTVIDIDANGVTPVVVPPRTR
jgi:Icc-related predicted phosphoesterase